MNLLALQKTQKRVMICLKCLDNKKKLCPGDNLLKLVNLNSTTKLTINICHQK